MNKVLVPNHVAEAQEADIKENQKEESIVNNAYVPEEERVLDPTLLDKSLLERMPTPAGWRILVLPYAGKGVSSGGIHLVQETVSRETLATVVAYVLKKGPLDDAGFMASTCSRRAAAFSTSLSPLKEVLPMGT